MAPKGDNHLPLFPAPVLAAQKVARIRLDADPGKSTLSRTHAPPQQMAAKAEPKKRLALCHGQYRCSKAMKSALERARLHWLVRTGLHSSREEKYFASRFRLMIDIERFFANPSVDAGAASAAFTFR